MKTLVFQHRLNAHHEQCASNRKHETELSALAWVKREEQRKSSKPKQNLTQFLDWIVPYKRKGGASGSSGSTSKITAGGYYSNFAECAAKLEYCDSNKD